MKCLRSNGKLTRYILALIIVHIETNKGHYIPLNISTCIGFLKRYSTFQNDVTWVKVNSTCIENFLEAVFLNLIAYVFQDRVPLNI